MSFLSVARNQLLRLDSRRRHSKVKHIRRRRTVMLLCLSSLALRSERLRYGVRDVRFVGHARDTRLVPLLFLFLLGFEVRLVYTRSECNPD